MILEIELSKEEMIQLSKGGFISMVFPNGIRAIIKKDQDDKPGEKSVKK